MPPLSAGSTVTVRFPSPPQVTETAWALKDHKASIPMPATLISDLKYLRTFPAPKSLKGMPTAHPLAQLQQDSCQKNKRLITFDKKTGKAIARTRGVKNPDGRGRTLHRTLHIDTAGGVPATLAAWRHRGLSGRVAEVPPSPTQPRMTID